MAKLLNFNMEDRDPIAAGMDFLEILRHMVRNRDNLMRAYLLPQVIPWLRTDFVPKRSYTFLEPFRFRSRTENRGLKINLEVYSLILKQWYEPETQSSR